MGAFNTGRIGSVFVDIEGDLSKLEAAMNQAVPEAQKAGEKISQALVQGTRVANVGEYFDNLGGSISNFGTAVGNAIDHFQQFTPQLDKFGAAATSIGTKLSIGITVPLTALGTAAIKSAADMDALERGLTAVTGSSDEAQRQLVQLREVAKLPGLGLKEAVQGATNLQALGFSADTTQKVLLAFGNALASVGRGKDDLNEVIRQLGQLGARGQVTADNLRPIIERVPQVAAIIKREFGPEALSQPAERFKQLGVSSEKFIEVLTRELGKLPKVTGGLKNDLENFQDAMFESLSKIGKELTPFVSQFTETAVPAIQELVKAFVALPDPVKRFGIEAAILAAVIGPLFGTVGQLAAGLSSLIKLLGAVVTPTITAATAMKTMDAATVSATSASSKLGSVLGLVGGAGVTAIIASFGAAALVTASNIGKMRDEADTAFDALAKGMDKADLKTFEDRLKNLGVNSLADFKNLDLEDLEALQKNFEKFTEFKAPVDALKFSITDMTGATKAASVAVDEHGQKHAAAAANVSTHSAKQKEVKASIDEATASFDRMNQSLPVASGNLQRFATEGVQQTITDLERMGAVMENGVAVIRGATFAVQDLGNAFRDLGSAAVVVDGLTGRVEKLADVAARAAQTMGQDWPGNSQEGLNSAATSNNTGVAGSGGAKISGAAFLSLLKQMGAPEDVIDRAAFGMGLVKFGEGSYGSQSDMDALTKTFTSNIIKLSDSMRAADEAARQASVGMDTLTAQLEEAKNAAYGEDKTEALGDFTQEASDLQEEVNRLASRLYDLRMEGMESSDEYRDLQQQLMRSAQQLDTVNLRLATMGVTTAIASSGLHSLNAATNAISGAAKVAAENIIATTDKIYASMPGTAKSVPQTIMPNVGAPVGTGSPSGGAAGGSLVNVGNGQLRWVPPGGVTVVQNINGGTFSSNAFLDEVGKGLVDTLGRDVGAKL